MSYEDGYDQYDGEWESGNRGRGRRGNQGGGQALTVVNADEAAGMEAVELALLQKDLKLMTVPQRLDYYKQVCESLGLNPLTQPFQYLTLNNNLVLYATKNCTDQIRALKGISVRVRAEALKDVGLFLVTAVATDRTGREDTSIGVVSVRSLSGENLANAMMKAETKAKRRATLALAGLGFLDESEIESIPGAKVEVVSDDGELMTGTLIGEAPAESLAEAAKDTAPKTRGQRPAAETAPPPEETPKQEPATPTDQPRQSSVPPWVHEAVAIIRERGWEPINARSILGGPPEVKPKPSDFIAWCAAHVKDDEDPLELFVEALDKAGLVNKKATEKAYVDEAMARWHADHPAEEEPDL